MLTDADGCRDTAKIRGIRMKTGGCRHAVSAPPYFIEKQFFSPQQPIRSTIGIAIFPKMGSH